MEEGRATHCSVLALRIPWTEEPGELQSMGLQESDMTEQLRIHAPEVGRGEGGVSLELSERTQPC